MRDVNIYIYAEMMMTMSTLKMMLFQYMYVKLYFRTEI